jgi:hypothetical protein
MTYKHNVRVLPMKVSILLLIFLSINLVACLGEKAPETPETPETSETPINDEAIGSAVEGCDKALASYNNFQQIYNDCIAWDGNKATLKIKYRSDDATTPGIGLRIHYSSSQLSFSEIVEKFETDLIAESVYPDRENEDNDQSTDMVILLGWASLFGNWPGEEEANLATIEFTKVDTSNEDYVVNYTSSSNAAGFELIVGK